MSPQIFTTGSTGIGGYFPRSVNLEEFQDLLLENVHAQDPARWRAGQMEICDFTSNIPNIDKFDASYFGIHRQQCTYMDPMQRAMLEKTFEAIIDAGMNPGDIRGKKIGVYMGSCISENDSLMFESVENGFGITGQARTMLANRISYWLNVTGPSCSFDASWANGAQVLQFAIEAIRTGQCEAAVVGTSNLALNIYPMWLYTTHGYTSPDGVTRSFDEHAEGYLRGEGIIALYVQRADVSRRQYATVVHAESRYTGIKKGGFSQIEVEGLTKFLGDFYVNAGVDPRQVGYVEAYGCGIKRIDEVELKAIEDTYCKDRKDQLLIGTVKGNVGHTEAAEALMSLVKVIIAMEQDIVPATLHYKEPNRNIPALLNGKIKVVTENMPWTFGDYAAINSIGLSSVFGHILLKRNPKKKTLITTLLPRLNIASTRTEEGIKEILKVLASDHTKDVEYLRLANHAFSSNIAGHLYRGYIVNGEKSKEEFTHFSGNKPQVWFIYSGMGSQWATMGKELMAIPLFASAIEKCHNILLDKGIDLKHIITANDPSLFDQILHSFVGIAAIQIGLTDIIQAIGIVPDGIIGHSVGELGCAYADGCLTAEQMILSAYYRGKASQDVELIQGMMAAIGLGAEELKKMVPPTVDIACHNAADSSTLSGPAEDMEKFVGQLKEKGVFAKLVNVANIAYHSRYIKPAAPLLLKYLKDIIPNPKPRSSKWISTSIQEPQWKSDLAKTVSAEYLTNNLLSSVYFAEGCRHIPSGVVAIEIAPHGLLQAILRRSLAGSNNIPLTKRGEEQPVEFLLSALGKLYLSGLNLDLSPLYPHVEYPVSRGTKSLTPLVRWEHSGYWRTGLEEFKDYSFTEKYYLITMNSEEFRNLMGHQIDGKIVMPIAAYLMLVIDVLSNVKRIENAIFENIVITDNIRLTQKDSVPITVMVQRGSGNFEITEGQRVIISGNINIPENYQKEILKYPEIQHNKNLHLDSEEFYKELQNRGYEFDDMFKSVKQVDIFSDGYKGEVKWLKNWPAYLTSMMQLQLLHVGESSQSLLMPRFIRRLAINLEQIENENVFDVDYHISTNIITSKIAQIAGAKYEEYLIENKNILVNDFRFVSFNQEEVKDIQVGLNIFLEVLLQNCPRIENMQITEVKDKYGISLEQNVKSFFDLRCGRMIKISSVNSPDECAALPHSSLIILPNEHITDAYLLLRENADFVLVSLPTKESLYLSHPISVVSSFYYEQNYYYLLRKAGQPKQIIIDAKSDSVSPNEEWVMKLKKTASSINKTDNTRIYLTKYKYPVGGIEEFINRITSICDTEFVRFLFVVDKNAPPFNVNENIYKNIFQQDLKIAVYNNCQWGLYMNVIHEVPLSSKNVPDVEFTDMVQRSLLSTPTLKIEYINFDPRDFSRSSSCPGPKREYVGYSGTKSDGTKVMGVAKLDLQDMKLTPDSYFQWTVPQHWSMIDAASIPYSYAMAFNVLLEVIQIEHRESILVHDACSGFGQAAVAVAHYLGCYVYATVGSEQQKAFLKSRSNELTDRNIFSFRNCNFENDIMNATAGEGVNVVLNCFGGDRLRATIRCLSKLSRLVHYRVTDIDENDFIGLGVFLKCTCMTAISPRKLFEVSPDLKKRIHDFVADGVKDAYIKPMERKIFDECNTEKIERYLEDPVVVSTPIIQMEDGGEITHTQKLKHLPIYKCSKNMNYIVYGDQPEIWLHTVEWLIFNGAKTVHVITPGQNYINRRLSLLKEHYNAQIKIKTNCSQLKDIANHVSENSKLVTIDAIFILPSTKDSNTNLSIISAIDSVLSPKKQPYKLVCIWGTDEKHNFRSLNNSAKVYNIRWENKRKFKEFLKILNRIIELGGDIYLKNDQVIQAEKNLTIKDFSLLFTQSQRSLIDLADDFLAETIFDRITSSCPIVVREIPPLFVMPGLAGKNCQELVHMISRIMYPVHCVRYGTRARTLTEIADEVVKQIRHIQPEGPYNLLGVSWGGAITLEIASRLESTGSTTTIFLIDAVPDTIQAVLSSQQHHLHVQLLANVLNITDNEDIKKISEKPDWSTRLEVALRFANIEDRDRALVKSSVELIKKRTEQITDYQYSNKMINGPTKLFRPFNSSKDDSFGLTKYCKQVEIQVLDGNHVTMMQDEDLIDYINDQILV